MLDASGDGLHKRGYRTLNHTAPIKETLAASLIDLSIMRGDKPFADVFCGSGTIAIETALIARNIAPGIRRNFDFEKFKNYPEGILEKVKAEAKKEEHWENHRNRIHALNISLIIHIAVMEVSIQHIPFCNCNLINFIFSTH